MTRIDFEAIAAAIAAAAPLACLPEAERHAVNIARNAIAVRIADHCKKRNAAFDRARFYAACDLPS